MLPTGLNFIISHQSNVSIESHNQQNCPHITQFRYFENRFAPARRPYWVVRRASPRYETQAFRLLGSYDGRRAALAYIAPVVANVLKISKLSYLRPSISITLRAT